jgi:hypothetical protein
MVLGRMLVVLGRLGVVLRRFLRHGELLFLGMHRHNWLEAHVLRQEAETLLR